MIHPPNGVVKSHIPHEAQRFAVRVALPVDIAHGPREDSLLEIRLGTEVNIPPNRRLRGYVACV